MMLAATLSIALLSLSTPFSSLQPHTPLDSTIRLHVDDTLREVLEDWTSSENISLAFDQSLSQVRLDSRCGLLAEVEVSNWQIDAFVEALLTSHGIALTEVPSGGDRVLIAHDYFSAIASIPVMLTDDLLEFKAHPALRMHTAESFQGHNERQLPSLLRVLMPDLELANGTTPDTLQLEGPGVFAYDLVKILRSVDPNTAGTASFGQIDSIFRTPVESVQFGNFKTLLDLVRVYDQATHFNIVITEEARRDLRQRAFEMKVSIALPGDLHSIVSNVLYAAGFTTSIPCDETNILAIHNDKEARYARRLPVRYSSREEFDNLPSLAVFAPVKLKNSDARRLPATLRPQMKDVRSTVLMSFGPQSLLMAGSAGNLSKLWTVVKNADK